MKAKRAKVKSRIVGVTTQTSLTDRKYWTGAEVEEIIQRVAAGEKIADIGDTLDVALDPETGQVWLGRSKLNRKTSELTVERYMSDMAGKRWLYTHQGLAFDRNGHLIDGYQRILAGVRSGVTFPTQVTINLPVGTGLAVDQGRFRSVSDVATLVTGAPVHAEVTATAGRMMAGINQVKSSATRMELIHYLGKHRAAIDSAVALLPRKCPAGRCGVRAVIARAISAHNTNEGDSKLSNQIERFCEIMRTGRYDDGKNGELTAVLFREWLIHTKSTSGMVQLEMYRRAEYVLENFIAGRSVTRLRPIMSERFELEGK